MSVAGMLAIMQIACIRPRLTDTFGIARQSQRKGHKVWESSRKRYTRQCGIWAGLGAPSA